MNMQMEFCIEAFNSLPTWISKVICGFGTDVPYTVASCWLCNRRRFRGYSWHQLKPSSTDQGSVRRCICNTSIFHSTYSSDNSFGRNSWVRDWMSPSSWLSCFLCKLSFVLSSRSWTYDNSWVLKTLKYAHTGRDHNLWYTWCPMEWIKKERLLGNCCWCWDKVYCSRLVWKVMKIKIRIRVGKGSFDRG
jgi:hypothetical protein